MKTLITTLALVVLTTSSCNISDLLKPKDESVTLELHETSNSSFPLIALDNQGNTFSFNPTLDQVYVLHENGDEWFINYGSDYLPATMKIIRSNTEFDIVFGEFEGDKSDIYIESTNGTYSEYLYNQEFPGISDFNRTTSFDFNSLRENQNQFRSVNDLSELWSIYKDPFLDWFGSTLSGVGCFFSVQAAAASGGLATPLAVLQCGNFASSFIASNVAGYSKTGQVIFTGTSLAGNTFSLAINCTVGDKGACLQAIVEQGFALRDVVRLDNDRRTLKEAKEQLIAFKETQGLAGSWIMENSFEGAENTITYNFGLYAGNIKVNSLIENSLIKSESDINISFLYTINNGKLNFTFQRVHLLINVTDKKENVSSQSELGPMTWSEYKAQYGNFKTGAPIQDGQSLGFTIAADNSQITFDDGTVLKRMK